MENEYNKYNKFLKIIKKNDSLKELEIANNVLEKVLEYKKMEAMLEKIDEELTSDSENIMFYYHAMIMGEDEVLFAKQKLSSKLKSLRKKEEQKEKKE